MDIFSALQTSVSGLQAQSYAISNISGNIANSQTTGYKRVDTSFVDIMAEYAPKREVAGSVLAQSQLTNAIAGNVISTQVSTNMAISGSGFFTIAHKTSDAGGTSTFGGANLYTRRGDFAPDKDGYLVNGSGGYLIGTNLDPVTGQSTGVGPIRINNSSLPARQTSSITYAGNLPAKPITNGSKVSGSDVYNQNAGAVILNGTGQPGPTVAIADAGTFVDNSIVGPSLPVYTATGAPVQMNTRWAKVQDGTTNPSQPAIWNLYYQTDPTSASDKSSWQNVGTAFKFDSTGVMTSPTNTSIPLGSISIGDFTSQAITLKIDSAGLTQYADSTGAATAKSLTQDGSNSGTLTSISVGTDGKINGTFSNGSLAALANVGIVKFNNPNGLKADTNGNYVQTADSGAPLAGLNGSTLNGSSIEQSNTDIASEFSKMIVTQQAYSANTKVLSTAQTMMSDLLNVIR